MASESNTVVAADVSTTASTLQGHHRRADIGIDLSSCPRAPPVDPLSTGDDDSSLESSYHTPTSTSPPSEMQVMSPPESPPPATAAGQNPAGPSACPVCRRETEEEEWEKETRGALIVAASLIASVTYQAGMNPPGGLWQDDKSDGRPDTHHSAGDPIMLQKHTQRYEYFRATNSVVFVYSIFFIILLIMMRMRRKRRLYFVGCAMSALLLHLVAAFITGSGLPVVPFTVVMLPSLAFWGLMYVGYPYFKTALTYYFKRALTYCWVPSK